MKRGIRAIWIVHDPSDISEAADIYFQVTVADLAVQVRGGFDPEHRHRNAVFHVLEEDAVEDAERRIRERDEARARRRPA